MGYARGKEYADNLDLEEGLRMQLRYNHDPPVHSCMVPVAIEAVGHYRAGRHDHKIELPDGALYRKQKTVTAGHVVMRYHLEPWLHNSSLNEH